jgi:hypothetical protein
MAANQPEGALLYARLGLPPDCTLEQFKLACRQRIAELHPDKSPAGAAPSSPDLPISELISLYVSAVRFHRRHGRLPGGQPIAAARALTPAPQAHPATQTSEATAPEPGDVAPPLSLRTWLLVAVAVALLLALLAALDREPISANHATANPAPAEAADRDLAVETAATAPSQLELGMDQATVLAIQGEPLQYDDRDWLYGPSWIRFEKGRVVDWYSSPLHRLRTATPAPMQSAVEETTP